jgi:hypothetical protein
MSEQQKKTQTKPRQDRPTTEDVRGQQQPNTAALLRGFEDAQYKYTQEVREIWHTSQQLAATASQNYLQAQQQALTDVQRRALDAYQTYTQSLLEASGKEDAQRQVESNHSNYVQAVQQVQGDAQNLASEAYQNYVQALSGEEGSAALQKRLREAFRSYVRAVQQAWAQVDVKTLEPEVLLTINQSIASVATSAHGTYGQQGS